MTTIQRPKPDEHAPYYARYIDRVPDGDLVAQLEEQLHETSVLLDAVSPDMENYAYGPDKWTVKEVVGHMADTERVFAFRALWFARNDKTDLPGFDENSWVPNGGFAGRTLKDLIAELRVVRANTLHLARHLEPEALARTGRANGQPVSVRALFYIIAGHERHHAALLRERYLLQ